MKNFVLTFASLFISVIGLQATTIDEGFNRDYDGKSFIFVEGGVEFSIFPDGQFDFVYLGNQGSQLSINTPNIAVNFNSGYNYDAYVQYDNYGAVIQIEDVPVYYDEYGRISQAGSVTIRYNDRRVVQVGSLYVHYNPYGYYSHYTGYINSWNRYYVYRPWHAYYAIPYYTYCVVYATPYRGYYFPERYSYSHHRNYYNRSGYAYTNGRRDFYRPGSRVHYKDGRVTANKDFRFSNTRGNSRDLATTYRRDDNVARSNFSARQENTTQRSAPANATVSRNETTQRGTPANANNRKDTAQRTAPSNNISKQTNQVRSSTNTKNNHATKASNTRGNTNSSSSRGGRG